jgi:hypothetical protein
MAEELDYVADARKVVADIVKTWSGEIKDSGGKPLFTQLSPNTVTERRRWAPFPFQQPTRKERACADGRLTAQVGAPATPPSGCSQHERECRQCRLPEAIS